ncbi:hypothetical protein ACFYZ4_25575 [Streptomyces sp. NPDC001513]|uniref:hypothetical protein n=1 Tax=Streptomyces sp. NPDC001513 TaxID=3364580 RepID=UPI003689668D
MSRPRRLARAVLTVWAGLAVAVLAVLLPAASAPAPVPAAAPAPAVAAGSAPAVAPAPAVAAASGFLAAAAAASASDDGRPACSPGVPDHGGLPAAPARAGGEHAHVPPARPVPEGARPYAAMPVRVLVRGPDRPAPGPVELSVMRV